MSTMPQRASLEQNPQFPVLDTLRAVGALAVLTTHTAFQSGAYVRHGIWGALLARLDIGVAIFFVLSGFLLARPYLARAAARKEPPAIGRYYWKRFLRVYPVYAVTVVIALALLPDNDHVGVLGWLKTLLLADVYTSGHLQHGLTQMWSLAVEVAFYIVLPGLMLAAIGKRHGLRPVRVVGVLVILVVLGCCWHLGLSAEVGAVTSGAPMLWLPAFLTWFAVGIALALAHVVSQVRLTAGRAVRLLSVLGSMPGAIWVIAGGLMLVVATPVGGPTELLVATPGESMVKNLLYAVIGGLLVLSGIFADPGSRYVRIMSMQWLRHFGRISYSTFCIHLPVLHLVMGVTGSELFDANGLLIWTLTLVLSLLASELLYVVVEKPGMRLRNLGRGAELASPTDQPNNAPQARTTR